MNRTAGSGLIGIGVVVAVAGAIMKYAVTVQNQHHFNITSAGMILLIAGIVMFAMGVIVVALGTRRRTTLRENVRMTPQGRQRVEERDDWA